jgi:hypothetical protein
LTAAFTYRRTVRDGEREQASHVTVWVELATAGVEGKDILHVTNASDAAIYSVVVFYRRRKPESSLSPYYEASEADDSALVALGRWASLGPATAEVTDYKRSILTDPAIPWVYFRDSNGVDWIRDYRAKLKRTHYWGMDVMSRASYAGKTPIWLRALLLPGQIKDKLKQGFNRVRNARQSKDSA